MSEHDDLRERYLKDAEFRWRALIIDAAITRTYLSDTPSQRQIAIEAAAELEHAPKLSGATRGQAD